MNKKMRASCSYAHDNIHSKDSSSLFFPTSGKKIKAEEGKVVIFPGNVRHSVPPNKCDNRIVVAGNIGYDFST